MKSTNADPRMVPANGMVRAVIIIFILQTYDFFFKESTDRDKNSVKISIN